uniref:Putative ficolin n=1 Tax=Aedes albopictus TaxID=7160 RepID=A0A1W7R8N1_AEDAL
MKVKILTIICVFCAVHYHEATKVSSDCSNCPANSGSFGYELLLGKLEDLEAKFWNMWLEMKEQTENQIRFKDTQKEIKLMLTKLEDRSSEILEQHLSCANHENWKKTVLAMQLGRRSNSSLLDNLKPFKSCAEISSYISGKYTIHPLGFEKPFEAYCEQSVFDGGWTVVQYRFDGSVDFNRNWTDYRNGFGKLDGEFWIGLEKLHRLTKSGDHQLLVETKTFNGTYKFARYDEFVIGTEDEKYALKKVGSYNGSAGDGLKYHINMQFSTKDNDNDRSGSNCAVLYKGAWWYNNCYRSNLNGLYKKGNHQDSMNWDHHTNECEGLAYSRMMIRKTPNNAETCP